MNFDAVTIERMVREVLNQVQSPATVRHEATAASGNKPADDGKPATESAKTSAPVTIRERVVTADLLQEQAQPGSKIVIAKQAILTPAAQDYLRNNRITFERQAPVVDGSQSSTARWKILLSSVAEHTARAIDAVCRQQSQIQREVSGNANESAAAAISAISRAEVAGVIVVTNSPEVVACRTNRNAAIRAAVVMDLAAWSRIVSQLSPNVVCLSPHGKSFMELQNLVNKVVSGPVPEVPGDWL